MSKRYLIRTNITPFEDPSYYDAIRGNVVRSNSGNLLFPQSIVRALMTDDDTEFVPINTHGTFSDEQVETFNADYDAFLIPLANAFRVSFMEELANMTSLVRRLYIPCVVIGIGFQGNLAGDISRGFAWADTARDFCHAVLEKSAKIGLRGEITASFMDYLGFTRGKDYEIIGCPSLFLYGDDLPKPKELSLCSDVRIHVNSKVDLPQKWHTYLKQVCDVIPDHYYLPQNQYELCAMYSGLPLAYFRPDLKRLPEYYPSDAGHQLYQENRVRGFFTAQSWLDFLREGNLNFGTRIHGNIAAVLAGIPAFIVAPDSRVLELAEYHHIPHITMKDLDLEESIFALLEDADFDSVLDGHTERFHTYLSFLKENGLDTIFDKEKNDAQIVFEQENNTSSIVAKCPFDRKMETISFQKPLQPYRFLKGKDKRSAFRYRELFLAKRFVRKHILRRG